MALRAGYHTRGYLPHIKVAGAAYFVTFRLADSLPREVILRLKERRDDLLGRAAENHEQVRRDLFAWYAAEVDSVLDQHKGAAWLRDRPVADLVARALAHFDGARYRLHAWCIMPNHVHAVIRPLAGHSLEAILHTLKSYTAHEANRHLNRRGDFWQRESYDHWIRDDADLNHCIRYTEENPMKAQLCGRPCDWPWSSASRE